MSRLEHHDPFPAERVSPRRVDVWLPPAYDAETDRRFPVMYMHDGQNLFDPDHSYIGEHWGIAETMIRLIEEDDVPETIIVGVWNSERRLQEYMPEKPYSDLEGQQFADIFLHKYEGEPISDDYLGFLVKELKPFIDKTYRTLPAAAHTDVMGSSMGGLITLYAICEYPDVFGGAGCLSTHWPLGRPTALAYLADHIPDPTSHKLYLDYGDEALDPHYEPYQSDVENLLLRSGYEREVNLMTRKFAGHEHSERAWRERVHLPLVFLLGRK